MAVKSGELSELIAELRQQLSRLEKSSQLEKVEERRWWQPFFEGLVGVVEKYQPVPIFPPLDDWFLVKTLQDVVSRAPVERGTLVELMGVPAVLAQYAPRSKFERIVVNDPYKLFSALISAVRVDPERVISVLALLPASRELVEFAKELCENERLREVGLLGVAALAFYAVHALPVWSGGKYVNALSSLIRVAERLRDVEFVSMLPVQAAEKFSGPNTVFYLPLGSGWSLHDARPVIDLLNLYKQRWVARVRLGMKDSAQSVYEKIVRQWGPVEVFLKKGKNLRVTYLIVYNWSAGLSPSEGRIKGLKGD
ncbi:MAG: hypothetical protein QXZ31_05805 [Thermofilaceae archaeon]